ncbi:RHS repeat-associated core domain-containing protein [Aliiroseovarius halocynthiae]|uniref:RHS repeat-associated core domain-containing protein n=2 Tax=Aliiroseovarius halocynthiae TaxID=985055 RepID=A0A545SLF1_9RHOB|nr:RHS repeat-associated core domain-containing protein [Aliiroseovarius halocynthiae]
MWQASYLPFGGVHTTTGDPINLRFPGQWLQSESGLHQNWMRDYDPTTGRYIQADPLGLIPGSSLYGYVYQNPMYWTDPTGECPICGQVLKQGIKKTLQKLRKRRLNKQLIKNGWVCHGTRRDHFENKNCPDDCPERVFAVHLDKRTAQELAKTAAPPHCRAFYGHFRCQKVKDVLKK